jgi:hypothetical protein
MSDVDQVNIYLWPDGVWCYSEELEELLRFKSDDYEVITDDELFQRTGEDIL